MEDSPLKLASLSMPTLLPPQPSLIRRPPILPRALSPAASPPAEPDAPAWRDNWSP